MFCLGGREFGAPEFVISLSGKLVTQTLDYVISSSEKFGGGKGERIKKGWGARLVCQFVFRALNYAHKLLTKRKVPLARSKEKRRFA